MRFLINASNLKAGGGLQVADSICRELGWFVQHEFIVVLSDYLESTKKDIDKSTNVLVYNYNIRNSFETLFAGRDRFMDELVKKHSIEAVLTIFGPSRWNPRVPHLSGFAMAHLVLSDSPYYLRMGLLQHCKSKIWNWTRLQAFKRSTSFFYTENPFITTRLQRLIKGSTVYTVTNYYNQVFDYQNLWRERLLPSFGGTTLLNISSSYPHKNLEIAVDVARILLKEHPEFKFRFVFTINREQFPPLDDVLEKCFIFLGKVDISECPTLYKQSDIVFQPTLLECFTATYPEAMRMGKPIVTTDLDFAKGLCGEAAEYYSATDAQSAANAIYKVATDIKLQNRLTAKGKEQLNKFDNYTQRAEKLIKILEYLTHSDN